MKTLPEDLECIGDVMSNFDHAIEVGAEESLKSGEYYGTYPAWNFHGSVWFEDGFFYCQVKRYCSHVDTIESETLQGIMSDASFKYGDE